MTLDAPRTRAFTLPAKGSWVPLDSMADAGDALFDVEVSSNCIGAAVLLYTTARALDPCAAVRLADSLGARLLQPFGPATGLCYIESDSLGKAVVQLGSCEVRLTLLLGVDLDRREAFESAMLAAFGAAAGHGAAQDPFDAPRVHAAPHPSF